MGTAKVKSGSKVGKVQYPYDAMVYIDGTVVYAVDKEGNVIKRGVAGTDDTTVIQAAIDSAETTLITSGTFTITTTLKLTHKSLIGVGRSSTVLQASADCSVIQAQGRYLTVSGMRINVVAGQTAPAIICYADDPVEKTDCRYHTYTDLMIYGEYEASRAWTGIKFYVSNVATFNQWAIAFCNVSDIDIHNCNIGIEFDIDNIATGWINGNRFKDITINHPIIGIDFTNAIGSHDMQHNTFENIETQSHTTSTHFIKNIWKEDNIFINCWAWDWNATEPYISFDPSAVNNLIIMNYPYWGDTGFITGGYGASNKILNLNRVNNVRYDKVVIVNKIPGYGDFTTARAAVAACSSPSISNRYLVVVCGDTTESGGYIYARDYVDIVGINATCSFTNSSGIYIYGATGNFKVSNLDIYVSGTTVNSHGFRFESSTGDNIIIENVRVYQSCTGSFAVLSANSGSVTPVVFYKCEFYNSVADAGNVSGTGTFIDCKFRCTSSTRYRSALIIQWTGTPKFINCEFIPGDNLDGYSVYLTSAAHSPYFKSCIMYCGKTSVYQYGINMLSTGNSIFEDCTIIPSGVATYGYGVFIGNNSSGTFIKCNITSNSNSTAVYYTGTSTVKFIDCNIQTGDPTTYFSVNCGSSVNSLAVYSSVLIGPVNNVLSFAPNANNSGSGSIVPALIRPYISQCLDILGTPRLLSPFTEITGTSITDYTRNSNTLTAQTSVAASYGFQGRATYYDFNGSSHYLYRTNDTDFNFGNALTDSAFSIVLCVNADAVASRQLIGKWDVNNLREWRFFLDASGYPTLQLYDESIDKYIGRQDQTALTTATWNVLVATYDGSGICAGCKIYIDGVQLDDADYTDAGYVAMEAINTNLMVGALKNAAAYSEYYDGKMTWIGVAAKELSADEVWGLTQRLKGVLGI